MVSDTFLRCLAWDFGLNPCFNGRWSRTLREKFEKILLLGVLILVLMEDGLGPWEDLTKWANETVLILVLMEDGLGQKNNNPIAEALHVLILVLMEDGLGQQNQLSF